ncbi:MAG TPA: ATP-binding domain-containing protein [Kofleriaceae bacterium]
MTHAELVELLSRAPAAQGLLRVKTPRGERAYALGPRTAVDADPPMVDWRTAPLAGVFFRHRTGEAYELEVGDQTTEGTVAERWVIDRAEIATSDDVIIDANGSRSRPHPAPPIGPPRDREATIILDPEQQRAVDLPSDMSLVLDGEAGVGKTLVALYRVAAMSRKARERDRRFRPLVLVPTEGLRRLVRLLADRLGIARLEIAVLDEWLVERARAAFTGLPTRLSETAHAQVIALKRHPAVRAVLDDFIGWKRPHDVARDDNLSRTRQRLLHLWGDKSRLERILAAADGALPTRAIELLMKHTRAQFETTTEKQMKHVDADRLVALDGKRLDSGTPMENANTFDAEDVPVLFELVRRGALKPPDEALPQYDHIVVDEAQLRAPLELAAIADALSPRGTVTLAGDHRQATDETAWFSNWEAARTELARERWEEITLAVTYRSVPAIADLGRAIIAGTAQLPAEPPTDPAVWATQCRSPLAQAAAMCWELDLLTTRDPWRQICVIARTPEHARRLHAELSRGLDPLLVLDGDFRFEPGIVVTTAAAVSGLEFDCVVVPDLTPAFYSVTPELARSLYVAATRARDWLWLLTPESWSPLVQPR